MNEVEAKKSVKGKEKQIKKKKSLRMAALSPFSIRNFAILSLLLPHLGCSNPIHFNQPTYHGGPLLTGNLRLAVLWYGNFGRVHKQAITTFIKSLNEANTALEPNVATWWRTIESYQTAAKGGTAPRIGVGIVKATTNNNYSLGKVLTEEHTASLLQLATGGDKSVLPVIFAAKDVTVVGFCSGKCSKHGSVGVGELSQSYIMVGNPEVECPETCAWPFHAPAVGPQMSFSPPSGDAGADALVLGFASSLASTVTNPYNNGYFQDPLTSPLEAVTACQGKFGTGAFPGYPGKVRIDPKNGGSFNAHGVRGQKFLLPAVWNPNTSSCWTLL